ncbi:MAG: hypothetical protein AAGK97_13850 [Bacteroidota bacterium]
MEKEAPCGWTKVFENNSDGSAAFGNKSDLVDAVRAGYPVRLGFGEKPIEHFANANFVSVIDGEIFKGEVFAQTPTIIGQMPAVENDSLFMRFRIWNHWTKMVGTNGYSSGFMTDYQLDTLVGGNEDRFRKTSWYVEYPCQLSRNKKSH